MKKEVERVSATGDDLEILGEIIKNDPWLLEKVLNKIRVIRQVSQAGAFDDFKGRTQEPKPKKRGK